MSKITNYLNEHLAGDVVSDDNTRRQFSTDGSVLSVVPSLVVHPRVTDDIRRIARFTWRLAERGQILPLTARGNGTDPTGAAIGRGTILSFPAHMNRIMEFDLKYRMVRVEPGITMETLSQAVSTHNMCLPILSNGEIIQTGRISRRELNEKKGLQTLEGEIYRAVDSLIEDNAEVVDQIANSPSLDASYYALDMVKGEDGSFDLTPLFLGSQGTLGIISQAILKLMDSPLATGMIVAAIDGDENLADLTNRLLELEPSALEFIDGGTLNLVHDITGNEPWDFITNKLPYAMMFVEFDDKTTNRKLKKATKIMESVGITDVKVAVDSDEIESAMTLYDSVSSISNFYDKGAAAIPLLTDIAVSPEDVFDVVAEIRSILKRNHVEAGVWGNLGSGTISVRPIINLANLGQRQITFRLLDQIGTVISGVNGSLTGANGSGRLLSPWTRAQHDKTAAEVMNQLKKIFDPYSILNSGVADDSLSRNDVLAILRQDYRQSRFIQLNLRG